MKDFSILAVMLLSSVVYAQDVGVSFENGSVSAGNIVNFIKSSDAANLPKAGTAQKVATGKYVKDISDIALRIVREEFGFSKMTVKITEQNVALQNKKFDNKVSFEQALREALKSFLEDPSDVESPLALEIDAAYGELGYETSYPKVLARAKEMLRETLNSPHAILDLLRPNNPQMGYGEVIDTGGEIPGAWIFLLNSPISDHMHWAIVNRTGSEPTANYGFN